MPAITVHTLSPINTNSPKSWASTQSTTAHSYAPTSPLSPSSTVSFINPFQSTPRTPTHSASNSWPCSGDETGREHSESVSSMYSEGPITPPNAFPQPETPTNYFRLRKSSLVNARRPSCKKTRPSVTFAIEQNEVFDDESVSPKSSTSSTFSQTVHSLPPPPQYHGFPQVNPFTQTPDLSSPPGYRQDSLAAFEDVWNPVEYERSMSDASSRKRSAGDGILDNEPVLEYLDEDTGVWDTAVQWAAAAGKKLSKSEQHIWKHFGNWRDADEI